MIPEEEKSIKNGYEPIGALIARYLCLSSGVTKMIITFEGGKVPIIDCQIEMPNVDEGGWQVADEFKKYKVVPCN